MLSGSWFNSRSTGKPSAGEEDPRSAEDSEKDSRGDEITSSDGDEKRLPVSSFTPAHDAVLANFLGQNLDQGDTGTKFTEEPEDDLLVPGHEAFTKRELRDPFSGVVLGELSGLPDAKDEEQWNHLERILKLQAEVAGLHVEMEGIGAKSSDAGKRNTQWSETGGVVEDEIVDDDGEVVSGEEEFAKLADKFTGRKDALDKIMDKLGDLSEALTNFHALRNPTIDFVTSRGNSLSPSPPTTAKPTPKSSSSGTKGATNRVPPPLSTQIPVSLTRSAPSPLVGPAIMTPTLPLPRKFNLSAEDPDTSAPSLARKLVLQTVDPGKQQTAVESPGSMTTVDGYMMAQSSAK